LAELPPAPLPKPASAPLPSPAPLLSPPEPVLPPREPEEPVPSPSEFCEPEEQAHPPMLMATSAARHRPERKFSFIFRLVGVIGRVSGVTVRILRRPQPENGVAAVRVSWRKPPSGIRTAQFVTRQAPATQ
jgi:hypothetical protein